MEEIGVRIEKLKRVAIIGFNNQDKVMFKVHVFLAQSWSGTPRPNETEVADGKWWPISKIAEIDMMGADYIWLPPVLEGKTIVGCFSYLDSEQKQVSHRSWIKEVENLGEL